MIDHPQHHHFDGIQPIPHGPSMCPSSQEFVQRTAAQKMMQEVLEKLSPAEAWSNGESPPFFFE